MEEMAQTLELPLDTAPPPALAPRAILDAPDEILHEWLAARRQPPLRVRQIRRWIVAGRAESFDAMTDLPLDLRADLTREWAPFGTAIDCQQTSSDGTRKLLLRLHDGQRVECVMIPEQDRRTACISSQVGCGMGCVFCASGLNGVARNLSPGEILEQLIRPTSG
jgi:23S rRNA (adenine2503-C2)-methyltransferase